MKKRAKKELVSKILEREELIKEPLVYNRGSYSISLEILEAEINLLQKLLK